MLTGQFEPTFRFIETAASERQLAEHDVPHMARRGIHRARVRWQPARTSGMRTPLCPRLCAIGVTRFEGELSHQAPVLQEADTPGTWIG